jgi:hypothetical protein
MSPKPTALVKGKHWVKRRDSATESESDLAEEE